jgi:hypothetical protein
LRNIFILMPFIFLILVGIVACTSQPPADNIHGSVEFYEFNTNTKLTIEHINEPFGRHELNLKPQMEDEYPKLNGVESKAYELIDGAVFIHIFENNEELKEGKKQIKQAYEAYKYEEWGLKVYEVNNMLMVYMPAHATDELITEKHGEMIKSIEEMIKSLDEETVLSKISFKDSEQMEHTAILTQEDGVYLHIDDSKIEIETVDSNLQRDSYTMENIDSMIVVFTHYVTARSYNVEFTFFTYEDQVIQKVYSSVDMSCTINSLQIDQGEATIGLPLTDSYFTYLLTNTERERSEDVIDELKENLIHINDEFIESIAENMICSPIEIEIADVNNDGNKDVLLLTNISTVGARTPVRINSNVVFCLK